MKRLDQEIVKSEGQCSKARTMVLRDIKNINYMEAQLLKRAASQKNKFDEYLMN